jgi:hypothetical protein
MYPNRIKLATINTVSSFITYSSWEMAAATRPVPRTAVPVLVRRDGEDGSLLMSSDARWSGVGVERARLGGAVRVCGCVCVWDWNVRLEDAGDGGDGLRPGCGERCVVNVVGGEGEDVLAARREFIASRDAI